MCKQLLLLLVGMVAIAGLSQNRIESTPLIPVDKNLRTGRLPNGFTYYLMHNEWPEQSVSFYLAQRVGSIQEEPSQRGLAHFLEHMCFNGSEHFEPGDIEAYMSDLGVSSAHYNAETGVTTTLYYFTDLPVTVGEERLDSCLLAMYDWSCSLSLDSVEIEKERGVIHEEWRMGSDASSRIYERQLPVLYGDSKYAHCLPIGEMKVIDNFEHQELIDYYEKWYNPQNQCVVIVGDIDVDAYEKKIKTLFGSIVASPGAGVVEKVPVADHKGIIYSLDKDKELSGDLVSVMFKRDPYTTEQKKYQGFVEDVLLSTAAMSMLNDRYSDFALEDDCPYSAASVDIDSYFLSQTKDVFEISAEPRPDKQCQALTVAVAQCRQAVEHGFAESELERYKAEYISQMELAKENVHHTTNNSLAVDCYNHFYGKMPVCSYEDYCSMVIDIIKDLTLEKVNQRMKELLPVEDDNMVLLNWNIEKPGRVYPTQEQLYAAYRAGREASVEAFVDNVVEVPLLTYDPTPGEIVSETHVDDLDYDVLTLSNGARVVIKHTGIDKNVIQFEACGDGGWMQYGIEDDPNITILGSTDFGVNGMSSSQLSKKLAGINISLGRSLDPTRMIFSGHTASANAEDFMKVIHASFVNSSIDPVDFKANMVDMREYLENNKGLPNSDFNDSIFAVTNFHHPRFKTIEIEDLEHVDMQRILEISQQQTSCARNYTFYFVGDCNSVDLKGLVKKYIASLPNSGTLEKSRYFTGWQPRDVECSFTHKMETPMTWLYMSWSVDSIPMTLENETMAHIASRILCTNLMQVVREDNSAAYDCGADYSFSNVESPACRLNFTATCTMDPANKDLVIKLIKQEIEKLTEEVDEVMFKNVKEGFVISEKKSQLTDDEYWLTSLYRKEILGMMGQERYEEVLEKITIDDFKQFMARYLQRTHLCTVVMSPEP